MKLPVGWKRVEISTVISATQLGGNYTGQIGERGVPLMKMGNMKRGRFTVEQYEQLPREAPVSDRDKLRHGDVILNTRNTLDLVGKVAMWRGEVPDAVFNSNMMRLVPNESHIGSSAFLNYLLNFGKNLREIRRRATGTTSVAAIYWRDLESIPLYLPQLAEQQKIADILGTWDEALEKLDLLIVAKDRRKHALMQRLLTGQRRLPGFDKSKGRTIKNRYGDYPTDWSRVKLGDVTIESSVRADTTTGGVVLSCTKHHGLVPSEEYFGKRVYASDTSAYKVTRRGEFAYATNHIEEGSIGYQNICDIGLVSPIYTVFKTKDAVDDAYFYRLLKSTLMIHLYRVNTSASVDRRGSLRYGEFAEIKINLPAKPEQRAIADVLDTADAELRLLRQQRAALDQQKRGLMQQLLTGKKRVNV